MATVSLCIIARNEAANLAACLAPLLPLVHETIVVDTGSTDGTQAIATQHGARVFDFPWCDDFAAARNESLRHATGDWVLWMDADDRVDADNADRLAGLLAALGHERVAYLVSCVSLATDGQPTVETRHVRLFPSSPAHRFVRRVHEQILPALQATGCMLRETGIAVHHVGYQDHAVFLRKIERNLRLLELEYASRNPDGWLFYQRGGALFELGRFGEAIVALHLAVALAPADVAPRAYALLAEAYAHEERGLGEALAVVHLGRGRFASDPDLLVLEAQILGALGDLAGAEGRLTAALGTEASTGPFAVVDATVSLRCRHLLARVCLLGGRVDEAEAHARDVLRERPAFGPAVLTVGECLLAKGHLDAVDALLTGIPEGPETFTGRAVLRAAKASRAGQHERALAILGEARARDPGSVFLEKARVFALARAGDAEAAPALARFLETHPLDLDVRGAVGMP